MVDLILRFPLACHPFAAGQEKVDRVTAIVPVLAVKKHGPNGDLH